LRNILSAALAVTINSAFPLGSRLPYDVRTFLVTLKHRDKPIC
jgi:hypothetical protein